MKGILAGKRSGYYVTLALSVLSVVTAAFYAVSYSKYASMSWAAFASLIIGALAAVVLANIGKGNWAPWVQVATIFAAILWFIKTQYSYVAVVLVGIDLTSFSPQFVTSVVLLVAALVVSIVNIYLEQEVK
jgi:hypothetical protein